MRGLAIGGAMLLSAGVMACGGIVVVPSDGAGGAGASSSAEQAASVTTTSTDTSTTAVTASSSTGTSVDCAGLGQIACLEAYPDCAPVYDDTCCPSCTPGPCADCVDWGYYGCVTRDEGCLSFDPPVCGVVPSWACEGAVAECPADPGGSPTPCATVPGCVLADCPTGVDCDLGAHCVPVHAGMCTNRCDAIPPDCPAGMIAESNGFCYTGLCVPADVCSG